MATYTKLNMEKDVEDSAEKFGMEGMEAHFARRPLGMEQHGVTLFRYGPGVRVPFGHKHEDQEEVYVLLNGSARMTVEDDVIELEKWDASHRAGG